MFLVTCCCSSVGVVVGGCCRRHYCRYVRGCFYSFIPLSWVLNKLPVHRFVRHFYVIAQELTVVAAVVAPIAAVAAATDDRQTNAVRHPDEGPKVNAHVRGNSTQRPELHSLARFPFPC